MIFNRTEKEKETTIVEGIEATNVGYAPTEAGLLEMATDNLTGMNAIMESAYVIELLHEEFEYSENAEGMNHLCESGMPKFIDKFIAAVKEAMARVKEYFEKLVAWVESKIKDDKKFIDKYKGKFKPTSGSVNGFKYDMAAITALVDRVSGMSPTGVVKDMIDLADGSKTAEQAKTAVDAFNAKGKGNVLNDIAKEVSGGKISRYDEMKAAIVDSIRGGQKVDMKLDDATIKTALAYMDGTGKFIEGTKKLRKALDEEKTKLIKGANKAKGEISKLENSKDVIKPASILTAAKEAIGTYHKVLQDGYGIALSEFKAGRVFWKGVLAKTIGGKINESVEVTGITESIDYLISNGI